MQQWSPILSSPASPPEQVVVGKVVFCSDSPVCSLESQLFGLSVGDQIDIPCLVSANPQDLTFHWFFNKTKESKVCTEYSLF